MNYITKLASDGYSNDDILDLLKLFENQIIDLISNVDNLNSVELAEELHRLKGGADLLYLEKYSMQISSYIEINDKLSNRDMLIQLHLLFTNMREFIKPLKQSLNSN